MFELDDDDTQPLSQSLFSWRWLERGRTEIAARELSRIVALSEEKAAEAFCYAEAFQGAAYQSRYHELEGFEVDGRGDQHLEDSVQEWLERRLPPEQQPLFISWTERVAVVTDRQLFVRYWESFCYPVEDIVIWPKREEWVLLFDYKQRFYFAEQRSPSAVSV